VPIGRCTPWLEVVLIVRVVDLLAIVSRSSAVVISVTNSYLEELLEAGISAFFRTARYGMCET
jgi:hypothetical protein